MNSVFQYSLEWNIDLQKKKRTKVLGQGLCGQIAPCRPQELPEVTGAGEGAGGIRKEKEKVRPSLTVEDFIIQSMATDKENAAKVAKFSGWLSYANGSQYQEEEAAEWEEEARQISALCY